MRRAASLHVARYTMEITAEVQGTAAPYGHACTECARAKCKCILRSDGSMCERCHRLGKKCIPATQARKLRAGAKRSTRARKVQLEDKVEGLVTLLQNESSRPITGACGYRDVDQQKYAESATPELPEFVPHSKNFASVWTPSGTSGDETPRVDPGRATSQGTRDIISNPTPTLRSGGPGSPESILDLTELRGNAESDLQTFRALHLQFYPLIHIPASVTVQEFSGKWPFLWRNIRAICTKDLDHQGELGVQLREHLARRVVVEGGRSIDLLLGLLAHMSWTHHFVRSGKSYMGILSNMARSLVSDLGLDSLDGNATAPAFTPEIDALRKARPADRSSRSNEERRALLATYIMSASVSAFLNYECLRWSPEMERCASHLLMNPDCAEDEVLVAIARLSHISSDAAKVARRADEGLGPPSMHIQPLQAALEKVKFSLPFHLLSNNTVLSYMYNTEIMIYELVLIQGPSSSFDETFYFRRAQYLHACLQASKAGVENHLACDITQYCGSSFYPMMHCMHALQIIHRLSVLKDPSWDSVAVRHSADVTAYFKRLSVFMENVHVHLAAQTGVEDSVWLRASQNITQALPKWSAGLDDSDVSSMPLEGEMEVDPTLLHFPDDACFTDFFSSAAWNA